MTKKQIEAKIECSYNTIYTREYSYTFEDGYKVSIIKSNELITDNELKDILIERVLQANATRLSTASI